MLDMEKVIHQLQVVAVDSLQDSQRLIKVVKIVAGDCVFVDWFNYTQNAFLGQSGSCKSEIGNVGIFVTNVSGRVVFPGSYVDPGSKKSNSCNELKEGNWYLLFTIQRFCIRDCIFQIISKIIFPV